MGGRLNSAGIFCKILTFCKKGDLQKGPVLHKTRTAEADCFSIRYLERQDARATRTSVKFFADKVCLSPNYFGDLIKKETGKTAQEYIQDKIIALAKELLLGSEKTISEISYELGYQYSQHFNRIFKKNVGQTPNEYRKLQA